MYFVKSNLFFPTFFPLSPLGIGLRTLCCFDSGFGFLLQYFFYVSRFLMTKFVNGCCSCMLNCLWLVRWIPGKKWKVMGSCIHALTCIRGHSTNTAHLLGFQALWMSLSYAFCALCIFYILFHFLSIKIPWANGNMYNRCIITIKIYAYWILNEVIQASINGMGLLKVSL